MDSMKIVSKVACCRSSPIFSIIQKIPSFGNCAFKIGHGLSFFVNVMVHLTCFDCLDFSKWKKRVKCGLNFPM